MALSLDTPPSSQTAKFDEDLWDPINLLQVAYDRLPTSELSCVGRIHHGLRCRWDIKEPQRSKVFMALDNLAQQKPANVRDEQVAALAALLLCKFHGKQMDSVVGRWKDVIARAARQQQVCIQCSGVEPKTESNSGGLDEILSRTASRMADLAVIKAMAQSIHRHPVSQEPILKRIEQAIRNIEDNMAVRHKQTATDKDLLANDEPPPLNVPRQEKQNEDKQDTGLALSANGSHLTGSSPLTTWSGPVGSVESIREQVLALRCQHLEIELAKAKTQLADGQNENRPMTITSPIAPNVGKRRQQRDSINNDASSGITQIYSPLDKGKTKCVESTKTQKGETAISEGEAKIDHDHSRQISCGVPNDHNPNTERNNEKDSKTKPSSDCVGRQNEEKPDQEPEKCKKETDIIILPSPGDQLHQQEQTENKEPKGSVTLSWLYQSCTSTRRWRYKSKKSRRKVGGDVQL